MNPFTTKISRDIRNASMARNRELSRALEETAQVTEEASEALTAGIRGSSRKHMLHKSLSEAQKALTKVNTEGTTDAYFQEIAFEELDMLIGKVKGATAYKAINAIDSLSNTEKQILERVFNILIASSGETAASIIDTILDGFSSNK
jgi:molecular chaperone HtpG